MQNEHNEEEEGHMEGGYRVFTDAQRIITHFRREHFNEMSLDERTSTFGLIIGIFDIIAGRQDVNMSIYLDNEALREYKYRLGEGKYQLILTVHPLRYRFERRMLNDVCDFLVLHKRYTIPIFVGTLALFVLYSKGYDTNAIIQLIHIINSDIGDKLKDIKIVLANETAVDTT